jgi:2-polyprenyl-3-methyl-5-hydroxy-6-metoxy-1,4-benzoquinol methylase
MPHIQRGDFNLEGKSNQSKLRKYLSFLLLPTFSLRNIMAELQNLFASNLADNYQKSFNCNPSESFQKILETFYSYNEPSTRYMHRMRINLFVDLVRELKKNGIIKNYNSAIDIGCNCGIYSKLISDFGFKEVRGIDIDQSLLDIANRFVAINDSGKKISFENFNAEDITGESIYDFILCTEVIEHTRHPEKVIANIKRILKPGGVAVITLPNAMSWPYLLTWLSHKIQRKPIDGELKDHLSYPSYRALRLFKDPHLSRIKISGANLYQWHFLHRVPGYHLLNRLNYFLSGIFPLKYFAQFFFMVYRKK